ncbi:competence type IV pilus ATPase ComGA [Streptococcus cuniculipharyngis]|uniref:Type II/IV secretion system protein n=1 Tax=Streptococcus cuniculipharyngis TaxID=1562651 RepID=A0A5C5SD35_9STRE|nr:competence type IV pilus ATPase ComGA [Streptococcus cuniculipharyngis]TWS97373.1 type II/IV secretion system protein [Streptococcus cuniculipharyngis]
MIQELGQDIIQTGVTIGAQDIYLVPRGEYYGLYFRVGDERKLIETYTKEETQALISHFKFVAGMNVGEKRRTQLGSCDYDYGEGKKASLRLSTVGDYRGYESLVIRLLFDGYRQLTYHFEGLADLLPKIKERGLYLFSGPVGSGKTTLMYQLVAEKFSEQQIITIEDPVEIKQEQMLQLQLNESIGLTYDNLIKLSLRHRPDVLIIGEIRDSQTARAVVRASLTGAIVFSTVHAKSIPGVYGRLIELGVSRQELANSLRGIVYQRLIGGGGVLDIATEEFENHQSRDWNRKIQKLYEAGYISREQASIEKIGGETPT